MDERSLAVTRRSLHGVAELVLAGPQHGRGGGIRLRVVPGGFGTTDGDFRVCASSPAGSAPPTATSGSRATRSSRRRVRSG